MTSERRVEEKYRSGERSLDGIQVGNYRERNERNERIERGRQSPRGQRPERERFDKRVPEPEFRRDRRDDANQTEWRNRERVPGKSVEYPFAFPRILKLAFCFFYFRCARSLSS